MNEKIQLVLSKVKEAQKLIQEIKNGFYDDYGTEIEEGLTDAEDGLQSFKEDLGDKFNIPESELEAE